MKIYKVRATGLSSELGLKIRELGRIAVTGEVFTVQELRYKFLAGDNPYKKPFVELASNNGYNVNVDENQMIVDIFRCYVNTDGRILTNIFEIANRARLLDGYYEGYRIDVEKEEA